MAILKCYSSLSVLPHDSIPIEIIILTSSPPKVVCNKGAYAKHFGHLIEFLQSDLGVCENPKRVNKKVQNRNSNSCNNNNLTIEHSLTLALEHSLPCKGLSFIQNVVEEDGHSFSRAHPRNPAERYVGNVFIPGVTKCL